MLNGEHWISASATTLLTLLAWHTRRQTRLQAAERWRERRLREELQVYASLDPLAAHYLHVGSGPMEASRMLARRVCQTIVEYSPFDKVAMLLRDPEGRLVCIGSVGIDDLTVTALHAWGERLLVEERSGRAPLGTMVGGGRESSKSFSIPLGEWNAFDPEHSTWARSGRKERRRWRRATMVPIRTGAVHANGMGRMMGVLAVCGEAGAGQGGMDFAWKEQAIRPMEALAERLAIAMENEALSERLLRTEKLAGLGQLAGGVAHALNNPLTVVLGFAELVAETAAEPRVRKDAETILLEARRMKDTVQRLIDFWRPVRLLDEAVDLPAMLNTLGEVCAAKLSERGVRLEIAAGADTPLVRGSCERLCQVFEHLLNNASQAIANARPREPEEPEHTIRVALSFDREVLHVIVSDTGPGFQEPARVFDPFYTTQGPKQGAGLGLSICYGIVREHGGEISAFNLHPHGAAVVVELPVRNAVLESSVITETSKALRE